MGDEGRRASMEGHTGRMMNVGGLRGSLAH
jgi:hypothetical protein